MKKIYFSAIFIISTCIFMSGLSADRAMAARKTVKAQTVCPVMGDPINKKYFIDYKGNRIYFCCSSCPEEFKKDPEKYMKKLRESGVTPEKAPAVNAAKSKSRK